MTTAIVAAYAFVAGIVYRDNRAWASGIRGHVVYAVVSFLWPVALLLNAGDEWFGDGTLATCIACDRWKARGPDWLTDARFVFHAWWSSRCRQGSLGEMARQWWRFHVRGVREIREARKHPPTLADPPLELPEDA